MHTPSAMTNPNFLIILASKKRDLTIAMLVKNEVVHTKTGAPFGTRPMLRKIRDSFIHDIRYIPAVYEKAVGVAMFGAIVSAIFAEEFPITCVIAATLCGVFAATCYFTRHWKSSVE